MAATYKELFLEYVEDKGYEGHLDNKYYISGRPVKENALLSQLNIPSGIYDKALAKICMDMGSKRLDQEYLDYLKEIKYQPSIEPPEEEDYMVNIPEEYKDVTFHRDVITGKTFLMGKDGLIEGDGEVYASHWGIKPGVLNKIAKLSTKVYDPFTPEYITPVEINGKPLLQINTYVAPEWIKKTTKTKVDISLFIKLIDHLIALEEERDYFYAWLKVALTKRAYTYLVLSGAPGVGKNKTKEVLRGLFGITNTVDGKISTIQGAFNSQLEGCRLFWGDEWVFSYKNEPILKEIQNNSISIEKKGVDQSRATLIYCSMVIANNNPKDNYVAYDGRKFVPLMLNKENLSKSMTDEEIDLLTRKCDSRGKEYDPDFFYSIYEYVLERGDEKKYRNLEYKGPGFYHLADQTMLKWQERVLEALHLLFNTKDWRELPESIFRKKELSKIHAKIKNKTILWSDFRSHLDMSTRAMGTSEIPGPLKVLTFLNYHRDRNGDKVYQVGELTEVIKDFSITYLPEIEPKKEEEIVDDLFNLL